MGFIFCAVPLTVLLIVIVKTTDIWIAELKNLPQITQTAIVLILGFAVAWGGSKPGPVGPTKSNLKLLIAKRNQKKLTTGQPYGKKQTAVSADGAVNSAVSNIVNSQTNFFLASNHVVQVTSDLPDKKNQERHYLRLVSADIVTTNLSLKAEILKIDVTNGIATASVWFKIIPNSEPAMRFHFASKTATNLWYSAIPTHSTFPDTYSIKNKSCYNFYFDVPQILLNEAGLLFSPLDYTKEVAFGSPETKEPFDLRGGIAVYANGKYYLGVTGWRTNSVTGAILYFDNGRNASPPQKTQTENDNESI